MPRHGKNASQDREDLTGEHAFGDAGQAILALLFGAVWTADNFFLEYTTLPNPVPDFVRIPLGIAALAFAAFLAWRSLGIVFGEKRDTPAVIRKGPFGVIRHPVYMSEILLYAGMLLLDLSIAAAVVWLIIIAFLHFISRYEERLLQERFGREYDAYMREVPMWIPRIGRNKAPSDRRR